jgi:hypothetical protein
MLAKPRLLSQTLIPTQLLRHREGLRRSVVNRTAPHIRDAFERFLDLRVWVYKRFDAWFCHADFFLSCVQGRPHPGELVCVVVLLFQYDIAATDVVGIVLLGASHF